MIYRKKQINELFKKRFEICTLFFYLPLDTKTDKQPCKIKKQVMGL